MNGRNYSPKYARFLSADPTVPYPTHWYSYNRYMYVGGNPASRYDPSGFTDLYADGQCPSCNEPPIVVTAPTPPVQSFDQYWTNQAANSAIDHSIQTAHHSEVASNALGSYLPGTQAGDRAAQYWAQRVVDTEWYEDPTARAGLFFSVLWTEDTAAETAFTLGTGGIGTAWRAGLSGGSKSVFWSGNNMLRAQSFGITLETTLIGRLANGRVTLP